MSGPPFTLDDLQPTLTQDTRNAIGDVILQFARLDALVSQFVLCAFHMTLAEGPILLGTMDTRGKLDRVQLLYEHHGMKDAVKYIANLKEAHKHYVNGRNTIAHSTCAGTRISRPDQIVFSPVKIDKGHLDNIPLVLLTVEGMRRAAGWAQIAANMLAEAVTSLVEKPSQPPPEPPEFPKLSHPTEKKKRITVTGIKVTVH